jgi:hypothetical protein
MKYLKMLGLAAVAAAALTALIGVGSASALGGAICSTATTPCSSKWPAGTEMEFSLKSGGSARLTTTEGSTLDTCTSSTVSGTLTSNPGGATPASGKNDSITWGGCTVTTDTIPGKEGGLQIVASSAGSGAVSANATIEVTVNVFSSCNYGVNSGTFLGNISEGEGTAAKFTANAVAKKLAGGFLCPETTKWVAEYVLTKPSSTTFYVSTE